MQEIFDAPGPEDLLVVLAPLDPEPVRAAMLAEVDRLVDYADAAEWDRLVRACETLAVVGWGERPGLEALAERWVNGRWYSALKLADFTVAGGEREWDQRGGLLVPEGSVPPGGEPGEGARSSLSSQRIHLPKNPLRIVRSGNAQRDAEPFLAEAERLRGMLDRALAVDLGPGFGYLGLTLALSHADAGPGLATEYVLSEDELVEKPDVRSFVRPRLDVGRLGKRQGETVLLVTRHFTTAEGSAPLAEQRAGLAADLREVVGILGAKLRSKAPEYRVGELAEKLDEVIEEWLASEPEVPPSASLR